MASASKLHWENAFSILDPQINGEGVHVWPFDPSFALDVRFFVFDKYHNIRMNRHDYFEIFYIQSGETICQIQNRSFPMSAGDLVAISSTQYHTMRPPMDEGRRTTLRAAVLYFLPELIRATEATGDDVEYLMPFLVQDSDFPHIVKAETGIPSQIYDLMKQINTELPATSKRARLAVKTYLKMVLILLINYYAAYQGTVEVFNRKQQAIERLRPVFEFLEEHYNEQITVKTAAEIVGRSKSDFMRFFKQVTGQSFIAYLNLFRIAKAQELLTKTDKSISAICHEVGFCDQSYFSLMFRKLVHMTPLHYKYQACKPADTHPSPKSQVAESN